MSRVLLLGSYRQSLTIARALASSRCQVLLSTTAAEDPNTHSNAVSKGLYLPPTSEPSRWIDALCQELQNDCGITHLFPVGEAELVVLAEYREALPQHVALVSPDPDTALACLDKGLSVDRAQRLRIPVAESSLVLDYTSLSESIERIGFPCIVKPNDSSVSIMGQKALIIGDWQDLAHQLPSWPQEMERALVQRFVSGERHNCHFVAHEGRLVARCEDIVTRSNRANGTGIGVEWLSVPLTEELWEFSSRLCADLAYNGPGNIQFIRAHDGSDLTFLEFNPRPSFAVGLSVQCGLNLPAIAVQLSGLQGKPTEQFDAGRQEASYTTGVKMHTLIGDIESVIAGRSEMSRPQVFQQLSRATRSFLSANAHFSWSVRDPMPTLHAYRRLLVRGLRASVRRTS